MSPHTLSEWFRPINTSSSLWHLVAGIHFRTLDEHFAIKVRTKWERRFDVLVTSWHQFVTGKTLQETDLKLNKANPVLHKTTAVFLSCLKAYITLKLKIQK